VPDGILHSHASQNDEDKDVVADRSTPRVGRRTMLLGVAAAGVGASVVTEAEPASAANGSPVLLGESNKAKGTTMITNKYDVALAGFTSASGFVGVFGADTSKDGGFGLYGLSDNGGGIYGSITGDTSGQSAIQGVDGSSGGGYGVQGVSTNGNGVYGKSTVDTGVGVIGMNSADGGTGVYGQSNGSGIDSFGVSGFAPTGVQGYASTNTGTGVSGSSNAGIGVLALSNSGTALQVDGTSDFTGKMSKPGGSFKIDHPVDPAHKYLYHSFVESPDMMNVYNGTVALDGDGRATVELPEWFEALNRDYRYQLTPIGSPAPELHISRKVEDGKFSVAGGKADQEVSWQVTGIRQDAWANANRIPVEVDKPEEDRGRYMHPELFGGEAITSLARARDHGRRNRSTTPSV
jgi:hypothetical protein